MGGYQLTAIIEREGDLYVARCIELDVAGQGGSGVAALDTSQEAEILRRLSRDVEVTLFEVETR
jgi:hypothetical protein